MRSKVTILSLLIILFLNVIKNVFSNNWWPQQVEIGPCEIGSNYIVSNSLCTRTFLSNFYKSTENFSFKLLQYPKSSSFLPCYGSLFAQRVLAVYSACSHRAFNLHTRCNFSSQLCAIRLRSSSQRVHDECLLTVCCAQLLSVLFYCHSKYKGA